MLRRKFFDPALEALARIADENGVQMVFQSGQGIQVNYKVEPSFGTQATGGAGGKRFRLNSGPGLGIGMAEISPNEIRADYRTSMLRYGSKSVDGSYVGDLSLGTFDDWIEAVMRGTWQAASSITAATFTTLTPGANSFTAAAGSFITQGFRVGQIVRRTGSAIGGNNARNLRVTGVTATVLTVAETLTTGAADGTGSLDIQKRVIQGPAGALVRRSYTIEEYNQEIDQSELYLYNRINSMRLSGGPDGMALIEFGVLGGDMQALSTAASPYYTGVTPSTSTGMTLADAVLRYAGSDVAYLTGLDFTLDNGEAGQPTIGGRVTPDIFEGNATLRGTITGMRQDLLNVSRYLGETELELHALLVENEAEPKDYVSVFIPRFKLGRIGKNLGGRGAFIETVPFTVGNKDATSGYDDTMLMIETSAP